MTGLAGIRESVEGHADAHLKELLAFLKIPSISTAPEHKPDVEAAAHFTADALRQAGMPHVELIATEGHPLVYAESLMAPGKPTVLCYGHYDVQPPDPLNEWASPPFEPRVANGNIYARGAADDKGQFYTHVKAVQVLRDLNGSLPLNVKFLIEGEEEIGGASITKFVSINQNKLAADVALISDTALYAPGLPTLCIGLRGLVYMEVECEGPARDLHSGLYGGAAPNAIYGLIELLAKAKDKHGTLRIPGIYDDVRPPSPEELESWQGLLFDEEAYRTEEVGSAALTGEPGRSVFERTWARPTFEVHGIAGGFTAAGAKTVIPAKATAKVSMRLVPDQRPETVIAQFQDWVKNNTPKGVRVSVRVLSGGPGLLVDPNHPAIAVAARTLEEVMGKKTVFVRGGGSIPIVGDFARHLGVPSILMGFGLPDDGLHSPNEKFAVANYFAGITSVAHFFEQYADHDGA